MKNLLQTLFFFFLVTQICFAQWTNIGLQDSSITDLAVVNDVIFVTCDSGGVFRSTDGGYNWSSVSPVGLITGEFFPAHIAISPSSGSVFVYGIDTLYRSTDNGATWSPTFTHTFGLGISVDHNGIIFTGYHYDIHWNGVTQSIRSVDDGMSWTVVGPIGTGMSYAFRGESVITLGIAFDNYMINNSSDSGSTWQKLCDYAPGYIVSWNSDGAIVCGSIYGLYRSIDQCTTWTKLSSIKVTDILSLSSGGMLVTTNDAGIFRFSEEGDSIGFFNEGLNNLNIRTIKLGDNGYVYIGTDYGVWRRPLIELTTDILYSVVPDYGYQTYPATIQIKGANTHFLEGSGTQQVWLSMDQDTIIADSFVVNSNTQLNAYFYIPQTSMLGLWDVNVECSTDGILTKEDCFNILPPPAIIVVSPDSFVVELLAGSTSTEILNISNEGETNLYFNIIGGFSSNNYALQFDGIDDYMEVLDNLSLQLPNSFTVEAWGNIKSLPQTGYGHAPIVWRGNNIGFTNDYHFRIALRNNGSITWGSGGQDGGEYWFDGGTIITDKWYHFAYVVNGSEMSAYVNGELVNSVSGNPPYMVSGYKTYFGWATLEGENVYTDGTVDEVRIWNVVRTQEEIRQYMHKQLNGIEPGLAAYWQFNEGTGDIAFDKTVNANHGSLLGGVQWTDSSAPILPGWLTISTDSGVCLPHSSMDIELLFDATELDSGYYYASLILNSSDPFTPSVVVPIHMIVSTIVGAEDDLNIPIVFNLYQNYPNPFNPTTTIKYSIPELSMVKLTLFNLLGEEVKTLINEEKNTGNYSVEFNASSFPSGVYFYQLKAGEFILTKKMILLK